MGESTREIERDIDRTREDLAGNLRELEDKVRSATDWKHYFEANPALVLGLAFGGAAVLGSLLAGRSRGYNGVAQPMIGDSVPPSRNSLVARQTFEHIKGALMGIAALRLTEFVDSRIPGFADEYRRVASDGSQR